MEGSCLWAQIQVKTARSKPDEDKKIYYLDLNPQETPLSLKPFIPQSESIYSEQCCFPKDCVVDSREPRQLTN